MTMHTIKQAGLETALGPTLVKLLHGGDVAGRFLGTKVLPHLQAGGGLLRGAKGLASDVGQLGQKGLGMVTGKGMPSKGLLSWAGEHPLRRGLALPAAAYYGGELASAPLASDGKMQGMRENYWDSVGAGAGGEGMSGHNRMMDWLMTPGRAFRAGGAENAGVPNKLNGGQDGAFHQTGSTPGKFTPGVGATNPTATGTMQPGVSNYQKAQQALSLQAERGRETQYGKARAADRPLQEQSEKAQEGFQHAFPGTKIPGVHEMGAPTFSELLGHGAASAAEPEKKPLQTIPHQGGEPSPEEMEAVYSRWKS